MIIVLGSNEDPHVENVVSVMRSNFNTVIKVLDCLKPSNFSIRYLKNGGSEIVIDGDVINEPFLVWSRMKLVPGTPFYLKGNEAFTGFAANEWRALCRIIAQSAPLGCYNPIQSHAFYYKPLQQQVAIRVGLKVPETLLTNHRHDAISFLERLPQAIMKSISEAKVRTRGDGEEIPFNIMTMKVDVEDLKLASDEELAFCPHFFQEEIEKAYELRIVYVDGAIYSFKINSQDYKTTQTDWRKGLWALKYELQETPPTIHEKITQFMRESNLHFGSLDFIVDRSGQFWFLECNQDGAWEWLNEANDNMIAQAYAEALIKLEAKALKTFNQERLLRA
jgi:hypothetical protein